MKRSEIRELLKLTRQPGIISFAGGLPAPETFPIGEITEISDYIYRQFGITALQYGPTEGEMPLREELAKLMRKERPDYTFENVIVTAGSQQGLDLVARIFLDQDDIAFVELPSYIGGLNAFACTRANLVGVLQDDEGMRTDLLEKELATLAAQGKRAKFIYTVPDFQNPSGVTMSLARRKHLLDLSYKYEVPVIEDSPYRDLRFTGSQLPSLLSLAKDNHVIMLGTFSKIFCPGLRLAWVAADQAWLERMIVAKQSMDLSCPSYNQLLVAEYMKRGLLDGQIQRIRDLYGKKRGVMLAALERHMPRGVQWTKPEGGLFLWVRLPEQLNAKDLVPKAIERKVAYVAGSPFHCDGTGHNTMRLNFSFSSEEQINEGIRRLGETLTKAIAESSSGGPITTP